MKCQSLLSVIFHINCLLRRLEDNPHEIVHGQMGKTIKIFLKCCLLNFLPSVQSINSFPASGNFCLLLITFANSLDLDQARQNVRPDLDPNCLTL